MRPVRGYRQSFAAGFLNPFSKNSVITERSIFFCVISPLDCFPHGNDLLYHMWCIKSKEISQSQAMAKAYNMPVVYFHRFRFAV